MIHTSVFWSKPSTSIVNSCMPSTSTSYMTLMFHLFPIVAFHNPIQPRVLVSRRNENEDYGKRTPSQLILLLVLRILLALSRANKPRRISSAIFHDEVLLSAYRPVHVAMSPFRLVAHDFDQSFRRMPVLNYNRLIALSRCSMFEF